MASPSQINNNINLFNKLFYRYPEYRWKYTSKTGICGEQNISLILEEEGLKVKLHLINEDGADIQVEDNSVGIEIWNWSKAHSYNTRIKSVIKNLEPFEYRFLITSFVSKECRREIESAYPSNQICIIVLDFQMLPEEYLSFYQSKKDTAGKKFSYRQLAKILKNMLKPIFREIKPAPIPNLIVNGYGNVFHIKQSNDNINNIDSSIKNNEDNGAGEIPVENRIKLNRVETDKNNSKTNRKDRLHVHSNRLKVMCGHIKLTIRQLLARTGKLTFGDIWHGH